MLFAIFANDKDPGGLPIREATQEAHLEFVRGLGDKIKLAGPLMDDEGRYPNGTILVIEAENLDEAKSIAQNDPYANANLFENVTVRAWNWTVGNPGN